MVCSSGLTASWGQPVPHPQWANRNTGLLWLTETPPHGPRGSGTAAEEAASTCSAGRGTEGRNAYLGSGAAELEGLGSQEWWERESREGGDGAQAQEALNWRSPCLSPLHPFFSRPIVSPPPFYVASTRLHHRETRNLPTPFLKGGELRSHRGRTQMPIGKFS